MVDDDSDSDLEIVGYVKPENVFPHLRSECTEFPFKVPTHECSQGRNDPVYKNSETTHNSKYCDKCYCFCCDIEASKCKVWTDSDLSKRNDDGRSYSMIQYNCHHLS